MTLCSSALQSRKTEQVLSINFALRDMWPTQWWHISGDLPQINVVAKWFKRICCFNRGQRVRWCHATPQNKMSICNYTNTRVAFGHLGDVGVTVTKKWIKTHISQLNSEIWHRTIDRSSWSSRRRSCVDGLGHALACRGYQWLP